MEKKKIKENITEIIISVEKDEWLEAQDLAFKKIIKDIKIDGFRKGKAPRDMYEKSYGKEKIYMDAVDALLPIMYQRVLEETKLIPVIQPKFELKDVTEKAVTYIVTVTTSPKVDIKKYKGLKVEKPSSKVTKEEIEVEINNMKNQYAEITIKEGKIVKGDTAVIDFEGFKDGKVFEGGKGENYPLEIGSNSFIPGFEEQLIGLKANDKKDVEVTFPKEYQSEDLKGKKVTFKVEIKEVKTKVIPELNKQFFEDLNIEGVTDKTSLEKDVKEKIKVRKEKENENIYTDLLLKEVAKNTKVEIPNEMIEEEINRMVGQFGEQLKMQGMQLDQYYQMTKTKEEDMRKQMVEEANNRVKYRLMLEEIAKQEEVKITDTQANKEADKLSERYQMDKEEFLKMFGGLEMIKYDMMMKKAMEALK